MLIISTEENEEILVSIYFSLRSESMQKHINSENTYLHNTRKHLCEYNRILSASIFQKCVPT